MIFDILESSKIAIVDKTQKIKNIEDAVDLLGNVVYQGADKMIVYKESFDDSFFDLSTKFAGDVLQKYVNYKTQVAIVGDFSVYDSKSLKQFIYECNKGNHIFFISSYEEALERLKE